MNNGMGKGSRPHTRREFLKRLALAASTGTLLPDEASRYGAAVLKESGLVAYWPLHGSLRPAFGAVEGMERGGAASYEDGPLGTPSLALMSGRSVLFDAAAFPPSQEATVELFFCLLPSAAPSYNPCIIAQRITSPQTRFSIHYHSDRSSIDVWNGKSVASCRPPSGRLEFGEWHHLAVVSRPDRLEVYLDGIPCESTGTASFNEDHTGLPLILGASSPDGAEAAACRIAEVAVYRQALQPQRILAHLRAAGWMERRQRILEAKRRREAERARARRAKVSRMLRDPQLVAPGSPRIYRGAHLEAISFTVGGIGTGCIQMNGKGERAIWQIFNNFDGGVLPNSFFAVAAAPAGREPVFRALQTVPVAPFPAMADLSFRGEYPFAWYTFHDEDLPVSVSMEVYNPLIPLDTQNSAIPCAIFNITVANSGASPITVALLALQQNAVGYDGTAPILLNRASGYGGNRNRIVRDGGSTLLHMTSDADPSSPSWGDMVLLTTEAAAGIPALAGSRAALDALAASLHGLQSNLPDEAGPSPPGQTLDGALIVPVKLLPGHRTTVSFVLTWSFPNARHGGEISGWEHRGNMYHNWWPDALSVARYLMANLPALERQTRLYHDLFYKTNIPWWLKDRITSQTAILRSKTCFWAADGYFGAWEGCQPNSGCCAGNCTHVWHYAQAHARLFPAIARRMREETFSYQKPDGSLPHRHPSLPPAFDGQCGDILGAYREHLCSTDGTWLATLWPKVRKAMEHTIAHWDPDEDGVLAGAQWNTLDGELGGSTSWMGTLYLAALEASARMAEMHGEMASATRYRRIRASGALRQNQTLWNGEYYIQIPDPQPRQDYGTGCAIDQVLGEWWARQLGIPDAYPLERVRSALKSLIRYNFQPDFHGVVQSPRKFVADDDAGMQMITWPRGPRPVPAILYGDEVMTGFEYSAAGAMLQHGLVRESLLVVHAISNRYDGRKRTGLTPGGFASWGYSGNPFGDDECGKFYARAMSVWALLLAAQGFLYDGPAGTIGFKPVWHPERHASFFTGAEGWGLFRQSRSGGRQRSSIELAWGTLLVRRILLQPLHDAGSNHAEVVLDGKRLAASVHREGDTITIGLSAPVLMQAGSSLQVTLH
ncbi:MAG: GH116 family glycosyl-hydrolase [Chthonomonadales bacterium]